MTQADQTLAMYLHLARATHMRMQPMVRDKLLVLAGVRAEEMGLAPISALCRQRVLAHNARHLLGSWPTLGAAVVDERFQTYLKQLKRRYSREKAEHMLHSLGIELGRERELYANDLEYAAALLDTQPEAIAALLARGLPSVTPDRRPGDSEPSARQRRVGDGRRAARLRDALVVWGPFLAGLAVLTAWAALAGALGP
jgi:hypothetical protein